jgi:dTDP-glucose 4,6-dehydratase
MKKRVLIAGGAGFIASHLCDDLIEKGFDVVVVDNLITGRIENIQHLLERKQIEFIDADINQPFQISGHIDEIYNLASPASPVDFKSMPLFILNTASRGHQNLLELARESKAKILFASSSEVYGDALVHPQTESYFGHVNSIGPRSCYDEAKRFGESLSMAYQRLYQVSVRIARIFNTYGPRMRLTDGRIIPNFFTQGLQGKALTVYGDGSQTRSFCYVSDQCAGLYSLMQSNESQPVNIGNPIERNVIDVAHRIKALTDNKVPVQFLPLPENDPKVRRPDITRAETVLQWKPQIDFERGLTHCLQYFRTELASQKK